MPRIPESIVGHTEQQAQLLQDIASKNIAHAYLFAGSPSLGKLSTAQWFAHALLSEGKKAQESAGIRDAMERFIHPDFLCLDDVWIEDVNDDWAVIGQSSNAPQHHRSKAPAAKSDSISIEDVRSLSERLHETGQGTYVICVIRGIERMQVAAGNAFLKILEEPPARVIFLLTTDNINLVLPTILSRTRVLRFSPLHQKELRTLTVGHDESDASFALHIARGAPGMLVRLLRDPELLRRHRQIHAQAQQFWQARSVKDRLSWLIGTVEKSKETDLILFHLGLTLREHPDPRFRSAATLEYSKLLQSLETNAHRGLLLERFALAIGGVSC